MIVPMKKVSLVIRGDQKEAALKSLRKLGLVHMEITEGTGERLEQLLQQVALLERAIYTAGEMRDKNPPAESLTTAEALRAAETLDALVEEKKAVSARQLALTTELARLQGWGEIHPAEIGALAEKGVAFDLYDLPRAVYDGLDETVKTVVLEKTKAAVKCLLMQAGEGAQDTLRTIQTFRVVLPTESTEELRGKLSACAHRLTAIDREIASHARFIDTMKGAVKALEKDIEFQVYATGMTEENLAAGGAAFGAVSYFRGYIEAQQVEQLKQAAAQHAWGLLVEEPTAEDDVPTKLKNNKFVSLIYPLTDFLGTVPGYFEYDISGWFLAFILIFFGIIFGDGGYGLFILAVAAIPILKSLLAKKPVSPLFLLVGLFGLSTVVWGTLTCTWFGLTPEQLPGWLKSLSVPVISNVYGDKLWQPFWVSGDVGLTTAQNLQILCFSLALVQLTVAHIKGAVRNGRSLKMLGDIGAVLELIGIYYVVLSLVVNPQVFSLSLVLGGIPVGTVAIALVGVGFAMNFIFTNYEGSLGKSILASLKDIVSMLLGVVNVFSDIVSYIRLWAVGLAGAAISATVNELAGPFFGNFLFMIVAIVLLVFGHGLNMILNVLSVIVHGIRLNTLEFSSHLDMSWSGHKFKPFEE